MKVPGVSPVRRWLPFVAAAWVFNLGARAGPANGQPYGSIMNAERAEVPVSVQPATSLE